MTATDHTRAHALSVTWFDEQASLHCGRAPRPELHHLRLALDIQVEAMLLTLTATARDETGLVPWQRWLLEDLESARQLTAALVAADVEPSPALAGSTLGGGTDTAELLDTMVAQYTSMNDLLCEALAHPDDGQSWRRVATHVRARCRSRIEELHAQRSAALQRAALATDLERELRTSSGVGSTVPGEMLG